MTKPNKEQIFWNWCKARGLFNSNDTRRYGVENYFTSAHRRCQEWAQEGENQLSQAERRLIRLTPLETESLNIQMHLEQWYATPEKYATLFTFKDDAKKQYLLPIKEVYENAF